MIVSTVLLDRHVTWNVPRMGFQDSQSLPDFQNEKEGDWEKLEKGDSSQESHGTPRRDKQNVPLWSWASWVYSLLQAQIFDLEHAIGLLLATDESGERE